MYFGENDWIRFPQKRIETILAKTERRR